MCCRAPACRPSGCAAPSATARPRRATAWSPAAIRSTPSTRNRPSSRPWPPPRRLRSRRVIGWPQRHEDTKRASVLSRFDPLRRPQSDSPRVARHSLPQPASSGDKGHARHLCAFVSLWPTILVALILLVAVPCAAQESLQEFMLDKLLRGQGEAQQQKQPPGARPPDGPPDKPIAQPAETATIAGLTVAVWMPPPAAKRPMPLIVFSHGFRGCNTQSSFLMRALADKGYLVLAPNHHDAACGRRGGKARPPELHFDRPSAWNEHSYEDRRNDIATLLDTVQKEVPWSSLVDKAKIGLAGHSLGGYTVVGVAGGWESWQRKDVKAVLALSPYVEPFIRHGPPDRVG